MYQNVQKTFSLIKNEIICNIMSTRDKTIDTDIFFYAATIIGLYRHRDDQLGCITY